MHVWLLVYMRGSCMTHDGTSILFPLYPTNRPGGLYSLVRQGIVGNVVWLREMMWFRPCLKGTQAYFDRRWPPAQTEVCNYTGHKHGALRPGWSTEGPWERKRLHSFVEATEALASAHKQPSRDCGKGMTSEGCLDWLFEKHPEKHTHTWMWSNILDR